MNNENGLRIGIVGCGYQGGILAKAAAKTRSLRIVACADPNRDAAQALASEAGLTDMYSDVEGMLARCSVDAVFVATPHHLLAPVALAAIRAGKHVLCEKPIGLIEAEAAQIERAAAQAGVCVEAGYSFRRLPAWERAHELLQRAAIGEVIAAQGVFSLGAMNTGWKSTPETGGGPLLFIGSHLIDQILWYIADAPVEVFAHVARRADTRADETSSFQIRFARGATAQCVVSQTSPSLEYGLSLFGRQGRISLRTVGFLDQEIHIVSTALPEFAKPAVIHSKLADDPRMVKHVAQLEDFAGAIRDHKPPAVSVANGRTVLRVVDALFRSGDSGQPVALG